CDFRNSTIYKKQNTDSSCAIITVRNLTCTALEIGTTFTGVLYVPWIRAEGDNIFCTNNHDTYSFSRRTRAVLGCYNIGANLIAKCVVTSDVRTSLEIASVFFGLGAILWIGCVVYLVCCMITKKCQRGHRGHSYQPVEGRDRELILA